MKSWLYLSLLLLSSCASVTLNQAEYKAFLSLAGETQRLQDQNYQLARQVVDIYRQNQEEQNNFRRQLAEQRARIEVLIR